MSDQFISKQNRINWFLFVFLILITQLSHTLEYVHIIDN